MDERETITLLLESGETQCEILGIFNAGQGENERQYIAVLPGGETSALIFRCFEAEEGFAELENIDDDAEYTAAAEELARLVT